MPHSQCRVHIHLSFSTKRRTPWITPTIEEDLWRYARGVLDQLDCRVHAIGGYDDHIHLLFETTRMLSVAEVAKRLKGATSRWLSMSHPELRSFRWQRGYFAVSVGPRRIPQVVAYILHQRVHHGSGREKSRP